MILSVTPNTALDRALVIPAFRLDAVLRTTEVKETAGGKGTNVAAAAHILGSPVTCGGFLAGHKGRRIAELLAGDGIPARWTWVEGESRVTSILIDVDGGTVTVINEGGAQVNAADWQRFNADLRSVDAATVCLCGSLPAGSPQSAFAALLSDLVADGRRVWVDSSGVSLRTGIEAAGVGIKVNGDEIGELLGLTVETVEQAAAAARQFAAQRSAPCAVTLGAAGAVYADAAGVWHAQPPSVRVISAVGSGDSFMAGLLVGLEAGEDPKDALRRAAAAGTANALSIGGGRFPLADYQHVHAETRVSPM